MEMIFQLDPKIQAAIIAGLISIITAVISVLFNYRRNQSERRKIDLEINKLFYELLQSKEREKNEKSEKIRNHLTPLIELKRILELNEKILANLLGRRGDLEYHPVVLRNRFRKLQATDPKKIFWYENIKSLRENNHLALSNIRACSGEILTEQFRADCIDFEFHALEWERVWKAVETEAPGSNTDEKSSFIREIELETTKFFQIDPEDTAIHMKDSLYAQRFPERMRESLEVEIRKHQELLESILLDSLE